MGIQASLKFFLVDDDLFSLSLYEQHLRNLGYTNITVFESGATCLNEIDQQPHIIFLNYGTDIVTGEEVLKNIKSFNPDIYVVFICGQEDGSVALNALQHGAFDYFNKGQNDSEQIVAVVNKIIKVKTLIQKSRSSFISKLLSFFL